MSLGKGSLARLSECHPELQKLVLEQERLVNEGALAARDDTQYDWKPPGD